MVYEKYLSLSDFFKAKGSPARFDQRNEPCSIFTEYPSENLESNNKHYKPCCTYQDQWVFYQQHFHQSPRCSKTFEFVYLIHVPEKPENERATKTESLSTYFNNAANNSRK